MIKRDELNNPNSCMSRARDDEMTFVLLGRDAAAPATIRFWITERLRLGKNHSRDAQIVEAQQCADAMERTQQPASSPSYDNALDIMQCSILETLIYYRRSGKITGDGNSLTILARAISQELRHSKHAPAMGIVVDRLREAETISK